MNFMDKEHRRPSKFVDEERGMRNWWKHQQKLVNAGELRPERVEKFNQLLELGVGAQVRAMGAEERMAPVLEHVLHNHRVTNADVQKMLGVSRATAMRLLQKLDSVLEPVGHGAGGYYRIRNY